MPKLDEAIGAPTELGGNLQAGVDQISSDQVVVFTKYVKVVLPLDSYVFWVKADLVGPSALYNATAINRFAYNKSPVVTAAATINAPGSLHYATDTRQEEANTIAVNRVVFTSEQEIQDLNQVGPNVLFIGVIDGVKFAFSSRGSFYRQADLWHYVGTAVYSDMETQVVDDPRTLDRRSVIVSNSLPLWLAFNGYAPFYGFGNPTLMLYPSFLLPSNLAPPYGAVHIPPENTRALGSAPRIARDSSHSQLVSDRVKITLFGTRNFNALDFLDCVLQRSLDYDEFGIMGSIPVVRDEKRTQSELNAIAQKKTIDFEISYYQSRMNDVARTLILSAIPTFLPSGLAAA